MTSQYNTSTTYLTVVAGILWRKEQILVAQRPEGKNYAGYWELPGGKVEQGESLQDALARELEEELGITITSPTFYYKAAHDYGNFPITLHFFHVTHFIGEPCPLEGQTLRWISLEETNDLPFLEADKPLLQKLQKNIL